MYSRAPDLDGHRRVQPDHGGLEWLECQVLIGKDSVLGESSLGVGVDDSECDSGGEVVLVWAEPGVALGLLEDVVEEGVVPVVIHLWEMVTEGVR